jgi:hypothetical protein
MRLLSDDALPQPERETRAAVCEAIGRLMEQVEDAWKQVEPELLEAVAKGEYDREYALRLRTREQVNNLRREIKELRALLARPQ